MELIVGDQHKAKVIKILEKGIVVQFENFEDTGFIHLSQIANCFVKDPVEFVSVGQVLTVDVIEGKVKPVELSIKNMDLKSQHVNLHTENKYNSYHKSEDTKPVSGSHKPYHNETKPVSKITEKSIDDMIAESNMCYSDKMKDYKKNRYDRRKRNKKAYR